MLNPEKPQTLKRYLRGVLEKRLGLYTPKKDFDKALEKYNLLDSTEQRQRYKQQKHLESIEKELQAGGA